MEVIKVISKGNDMKRMEVIAKQDDKLKTLHIHKENNVWRYFVGYDKKGRKVFSPITVLNKEV